MFILKNRELNKKELMDDPNCDKTLLFNTYEQFIFLNRLFAGWHYIYHKYMRPYFLKNNSQGTILDVGCGGGDILLYLNSLATHDGITLQLLGIDPDPLALEFIFSKTFPSNISFQQCWLKDILDTQQKYDFVINNNVIHHLTPEQFSTMQYDAEKIAKKMIIFNDLARSDLAWLFFKLFSKLLLHNSFVSYDGCLSIQRSYTKTELLQIVPIGWQVRSLFPYRNLVMKDIA